MSSKQTTVMWLGILLIAARLFTTGQWSSLWSAVGTGSSGSSGANGSQVTAGIGNPGITALPPAKAGAPTITLPTVNPAMGKVSGLWLARLVRSW